MIECMHDGCERHHAHKTVVELETDTEEQWEIEGKIIPRERWNIRIRNKIPLICSCIIGSCRAQWHGERPFLHGKQNRMVKKQYIPAGVMYG